jgi:hypothetical protein
MIIFQPELFHQPETLKEFVGELESCRIPYIIVDDYDFVNQSSLKLSEVDKTKDVVILHTLSLYRNCPKLVNQLHPGTTFNFDDYSFSKLSSLVNRKWLFNKNFKIWTLGDLCRNFPEKPRFVRPDSGNKAFTGDVYSKEAFRAGFADKLNDHHKFVIESPPKEISSEFRFHICGNEIISQAFYTYSESWEYHQGEWNSARNFMKNFLQDNNICQLLNIPYVVLDVAVSSYSVGLVEHNCFNTSGIYPGSDISKLVECLDKNLEGL